MDMTKCNLKKNINILIDKIKQNPSPEISSCDKLISVDRLYGVFSNDNSFCICCERTNIFGEKENGILEKKLYELFYDLYIASSDGCFVPWQENKAFNIEIDGSLGFAIPIKNLMDKHCYNEKTFVRNIIWIDNLINNYLIENPDFVNELFDNVVKKTR